METKSVRLDLRCEGDDGTRFIVEMQQSGQRHFFKRCGPEWAGRYISEYTFREKHTGEMPDESISLCGDGPLRETAGRICRPEGEPPAFPIIRQAQRFVPTIRFRIYYDGSYPRDGTFTIC